MCVCERERDRDRDAVYQCRILEREMSLGEREGVSISERDTGI